MFCGFYEMKYYDVTFYHLQFIVSCVLTWCSVTFDDDEPNAGCARLTLTVKEMTVKKPLFGSAKPENAEITSSFDNG